MKYLIKLFALFSISFLFLFKTGFVLEAANPVLAVLTDCSNEYEEESMSGKIYRLRISLKENMQINAFQFRIEFDNSVLTLYKKVNLSDDLLNKYNKNNSAMTSANYNENNSNIFLLGLQLDEECANLDSGTIFSDILFKTHSTDAGECAKQLESIKFIVEVLEADNGNMVDNDSSWVISPNHNIEQKNISEDDLNEDTGRKSENTERQNSQNNTNVDNKSENGYVGSNEENKYLVNENALYTEDDERNNESVATDASGYTSDESVEILKKKTEYESNKSDLKKTALGKKEKNSYAKTVCIIICGLTFLGLTISMLLKRRNK